MLREDGERFLPWMADPVINYEHLHRYRAAGELCAGRRVLDLASGEGYGSAMLAEAGGAVVGLEGDGAAVAHAAAAYRVAGLRFVQGSITEVPFGPGRFDLAVCFEALEHVREQERLCEEAARVLAPGGWFLVSTPNRAVYSEEPGFQNPFHVKELDLAEFRALLARHFRNVGLFGQHIYPVSSIFPLGGGSVALREYVVAREQSERCYAFVGPERKQPRYFVAIASDGELPPLEGSFLVDASEQLFNLQRRSEGAVVELTRHLGVRETQVHDLEGRVTGLQEELGREINARRVAEDLAGELRRHLEARAAQADELDAMLAKRGRDMNELARTADALRSRISAMEATPASQLYRAARALLKRLSGRAR